MNPNTHPTAAPAISALDNLANWTPANADELARVLQAVHNHSEHTIISALLDVLDNLATASFGMQGVNPEQARLIAGHLERAGQGIAAAAADWIDRAREATGAEYFR